MGSLVRVVVSSVPQHISQTVGGDPRVAAAFLFG